MVLAKEEMAKKNNFTHLILIVEAQTHTQKNPQIRGLFFELLHMDLAKEEIYENNNFTHHILIVEAQINTQKRSLGSDASSLSSHIWN